MFLSSPSIPSVSYNSAWLHSELKRILGSSLIGLYCSDDLIYDSSGAITGIQQRQGQSGIKTGATLSRIKGSNGRNFIKSINPATGASFSIGSHICKAAFIVSTAPNTPIAQQQILFSKNDDFALTILSGSTTLSGSTDMTVYNDNVVTSSIGSINTIHIYGITKSSTKNSTIYFPGSGSLNNLNPTSNISTVILCSTIPTIAQRTQVYIALKKHYGITITSEDKRTAELPVDGAVVVAPLTNTWNNYGSAGGEFTLSGSTPPIINSNGANFNGTQCAYITTGNGTNFTAVSKVKLNTRVNGAHVVSVWSGSPTNEQYSGITATIVKYDNIDEYGLGFPWVSTIRTYTTNDNNWHILTLRKNGTTKELYIDGTLNAYSTATPYETGTTFTLAALYHSASHSFISNTNCIQQNVLYYNSSLSSTDQALVEDWACVNDPVLGLSIKLKRALGLNLVGLYIGEDMVTNTSNQVTSWPARLGPTLTNSSDNKFNISSIDNKKYFNNSSGLTKALTGSLSAVPKTVITVAKPNTLPLTTASYLVNFSTGTSIPMLAMSSGSSVWNTGSLGLTQYANGITGSSISGSQTIYESYYASNASVNVTVGGMGGTPIGANPWLGEASCMLFCTSSLTPLERSRVNTALGDYYGIPVSPEQRKAATLPVAGAVVVAPLTNTWNNYGSVGGTFTTINAPTLSSNGAIFDGLDDGAYLDTGYSADFTLIAKFKMIAVTSLYPTITSAMCIVAGTGGWGLGVRASMKWHVHSIGVIAVDGTLSADTNTHVVTLKRSGGVTSLYIDGIFIISRSDGNTGGGRCVLAGTWASGKFSYPIACSIKNQVLYNSALSDVDRAKVEDWARE